MCAGQQRCHARRGRQFFEIRSGKLRQVHLAAAARHDLRQSRPETVTLRVGVALEYSMVKQRGGDLMGARLRYPEITRQVRDTAPVFHVLERREHTNGAIDGGNELLGCLRHVQYPEHCSVYRTT